MQIRLKWNQDPKIVADCGDEVPASCLSRAVSQGISLHAADLNGLDLRGADLREADLTHATLVRADLRGADLSGADARWADFGEADLRDTNIHGAWLYQTNLYGIKIDETLGHPFRFAFPPLAVHQVTLKDPSAVRISIILHPGLNALADYLQKIVDKRGAVMSPWYSDSPAPFDRQVVTERTDDLLAWIEGRIGAEVGPPIGSGHHGTAYALSDGRVLKVTGDDNEVKIMAALREMNHPNIARVHDTFILRTLPSNNLSDYPSLTYFIVRDRTGPILGEIKEYRDLSDAIHQAGVATDQNHHGDLKASMREEIGRFKRKRRTFKGEEGEVLEGVIAATQALYDAGLYTIDIHPKNMGIVDGRPVLFDAGAALQTKLQVPIDLAFHTTRNEANDFFRGLDEDGAIIE